MHPPLVLHKHPLCAQYMEALVACHAEHPISKWWGACNDPKAALSVCLMQEKKQMRAGRQEKARREFRERQAAAAATAEASAAAAAAAAAAGGGGGARGGEEGGSPREEPLGTMPTSSSTIEQQHQPASTTATTTVPGRGRGRVVPRKGAPPVAAAALVPSIGTGASPPPDAAAEHALALGQAPWRARRSLRSGGSVPRYSSVSNAASGALSRGEPAVIAGLRLSGLRLLSTAAAAARGGGAGAAANAPTPGVTILTSAPGVDRFFELDAAKNADPRGYYHLAHPETVIAAAAAAAGGEPPGGGGGGGGGGKEGNCGNAPVSLGEWLRRASSWTETRTLCRAMLGAWDEAPAGSAISFRPNASALREASRAVLALEGASPLPSSSPSSSSARPVKPLAPSDLLDWPRALELLRAVTSGEEDESEQGDGRALATAGGQLWLEACNPRSAAAAAAAAAALLPMRALSHARVVVQVSGRRRAVLVDPSSTYGGVRPYPFAHPLEGYSSRGWEEDEEEEDEDQEGEGGAERAGEDGPSRRAAVRGRVAELAPGDALVIPAYWWAHQELLPLPPAPSPAGQGGGGGGGGGGGALNAALELRLLPTTGAAAAAPPSPGALRAQAARLAEGLLAASLGAPAVARCLEALARGGERTEEAQQQGRPPPPPPLPPPSVRAYDRAVACEEAFEMLVAACLAAPLRQQGAAAAAAASKGPVGRLLRAEAEARALCEAMAAGGRLRGRGGGPAAGAMPGLEAPRRWIIEEDAEAARFPTLFRHRLLGAREDWRRHAVPLLLAPPAAQDSGGGDEARAALPPAA